MWFLYNHTIYVYVYREKGKVTEYGHSRYLRKHKSYKKMFNELNIQNYINSLHKYFFNFNYSKYCLFIQ